MSQPSSHVVSSHVVSAPRAPFRSASGGLEVHQIPAARDNLVWLVVCRETGSGAVVDGPDAEAVLRYAEMHGIRIDTVLNTHTHGDHVGVNRDLQRRGRLGGLRVVGPARVAALVPGLTDPVDDGDLVRFGATVGHVLLTEGHVNGHVSYLADGVLFCGDTLFTGGCGYLFDGPPARMFESLSRLRALPDETIVCCAHEYTEDNLRFAFSVEPENPELVQRIRHVFALRARGECAVPSTIGVERATNPFLRFDSMALRRRVLELTGGPASATDAEVFAATRALKDRKDYRAITNDRLPIDV